MKAPSVAAFWAEFGRLAPKLEAAVRNKDFEAQAVIDELAAHLSQVDNRLNVNVGGPVVGIRSSTEPFERNPVSAKGLSTTVPITVSEVEEITVT